MKLRHLEIFYAVMTSGSLTRAAEVLHISQPAASKALKHAEQRLGFALFQRIRGKLIPTDEAYVLFDEAKVIYHDLDKLKNLADNLASNPQGIINIGCLPSLGLSLITTVTAFFMKKNPNVKIRIGTHHTADILALLMERELDFGVGFGVDIEGGVSVLPLVKTPLVYVDSQPKQGVMSVNDIDENRWVHPGSDSLAKRLSEYRHFETAHLNVQTYHLAAEFVKAGVGCSIIDIFSAQHTLPDHMIHPLQEQLSLPVCVMHRADRPLSNAAQNYVNTLQRHLDERMVVVNQKLYGTHKNSIV